MFAMNFNVLYVCEHDLSKLELNNELLTFNVKTINITQCALDKQLCDKILHFDYAYDIWNFLDNMYGVENSPCTTNDLFDVKENYNSQNQGKVKELATKCGSNQDLKHFNYVNFED